MDGLLLRTHWNSLSSLGVSYRRIKTLAFLPERSGRGSFQLCQLLFQESELFFVDRNRLFLQFVERHRAQYLTISICPSAGRTTRSG